MQSKKSIGILTDPPKTFRIVSNAKIFQVQYDQLPAELENKKQFFLDFLGGSFQEINTLIQELSPRWNPSVVLYINKSLFISSNSKISPYQLTHPQAIRECLDLDEWIKGIDILVVSLRTEKLNEFLSLYGEKIVQMHKKCVVSTGKSTVNRLTKMLQGDFKLLERKGVARFGAGNRRKILELLK